MNFFRKHSLFLVFTAGVLIRIGVMFLDYSFDVNNHIVWAKDLWQRGPVNFYDTPSSEVYATHYPNYPPVSLLFFSLAFPVQKIAVAAAWWLNIHIPLFPSNLMFPLQERFFLAAMMKLPAILADFGLAVVLYQFARRIVPKQKNAPILAISSVLLNPVFFYNSAFWGQIDSIPLFFSFVSFYILLFLKKPTASVIFFVVAILVKPTALVFFPLYLVLHIRSFGFRKSLASFLFGAVIFVISFLPFLKSFYNFGDIYHIFIDRILAAQSLPYVTNGAFNFWLILTQFRGIKDTVPFLFGAPYYVIGYVMAAFFIVLMLWKMIKVKDTKVSLLMGTFFSSFAAFLFLTKMHERYLILILPSLLLLSLKNRRLTPWFIILSFSGFLNLYHSWPVPRISMLSSLLDYPLIYSSISASNVFAFAYLFKKFLK